MWSALHRDERDETQTINKLLNLQLEKGNNMQNQTSNTGSIDFNALRLPQNFGESLGVRKAITRVPVRKPNKTDFFRVRSGEAWRYQTMILEIKEESETYVVSSALWNTIPELLRPAMLHVASDRRNNVFLIPIPLPSEDGRRNSWHESMAGIVEVAEDSWVRATANKAIGGYDMFVAESKLAEPDWPDMSLDEMLKIAFRDKILDNSDHPVIRQLLGVA